ncbi:MAG: hypothetical protein ACK2T6_09895 [Anaerolineae bacterium]|jgi:uncharacterized membrane protein YeaQ/YmgE (transglycosylase-associated protein family)
MRESQSGDGVWFFLRLLLGTAVGALAAWRIYTCVNLIESGRCNSHDLLTTVGAVVVLALAVWLLARTISE